MAAVVSVTLRPKFGSYVAALTMMAVLVSVKSAETAPVVFTDRAAFTAAVQPNHLIDFEGISGAPSHCLPALGNPITDPCVWEFDGVEFVSESFYGDENINILQRPLLIVDENGILSAAGGFELGDFYANVSRTSAIGFDVISGTQAPLTLAIQLTMAGGQTASYTQVLAGPVIPTFWGIHLETPTLRRIDWWMLPNSAGNIGNFNIDNVAVRRVPEPASGLLFSMAAALVVLSRRRMRAHKRFA